MKEDAFRYLVLQSLIVIVHWIHRLSRSGPIRACETDHGDMERLIQNLEKAKKEITK